jgi:hypothetical protein
MRWYKSASRETEPARPGSVQRAAGKLTTMRIARIQIENFRNFASIDVTLGEHAVIVDENKIGKSNLLSPTRVSALQTFSTLP